MLCILIGLDLNVYLIELPQIYVALSDSVTFQSREELALPNGINDGRDLVNSASTG